MGIHALLMSPLGLCASPRRSLLATALLTAMLAAPATPTRVVAQAPADTLAVLAEVGRHFRLTASWPGVILADSPRRAAPQNAVIARPDTIGKPPPYAEDYSRPSIAPRLAGMLMQGTGPVRLLARAPETPCDSAAMDPAVGIRRPWIGSSIRVTALTFDGGSAQVVAEVDDGTDPRRSRRDVGWWRYDLERRNGGWSLQRSSRVEEPWS